MTPLIGGSLERLGYGAGYALRPLGPPVPAPRWEDVLEWNGTEISASAPVVLDIGAAGKGQLVDLAAAILRGAGITEFLVDASGDMLHSGAEPLGVALEHPYDPSQAIGVVELHDGALCASAANRRAWGDGLHHVLDGATGRPIETVVATWTMAATAMEADALATALFMVDPTVLDGRIRFLLAQGLFGRTCRLFGRLRRDTVLMIAIKARVDAWLGHFTMYRLILWVLAVLAAYSLVLNALGWLSFGLPEMLVHLALCLGLTYASNRLVAMLFKVQPHSESSLITGLLLYFLFWPTELIPSVQIPDLAGVAVACVLASASKYVLAFRGRHIFNPAAAGAFIAGLTGLNIATWWAATPAMLWLRGPGVVLVLYRTLKILMACTFLAVAVSVVCVELLRGGMTFGSALWQPISQQPLLFFVGFMLTEPLTLPPRRWQQVALAVVVALLFAVPYNLGGVAPIRRNSPCSSGTSSPSSSDSGAESC